VPFQPPGLEEVGRLFPQLQILAFIGKGGMGAVYQARQPELDRLVALKILPPQAAGGPGFAERFNREARALARLSHPNIVTVHEFGQAGGSPFFIMEFVDGLTLRQLEQAGRLAPDEALRIVPQICEALQYAHDEGIVHRDIKPENILIDKKGRVKIADFGIAKILAPQAGRAGLPVSPEIGSAQQQGPTGVIGTPNYMAPEQLEQPQTVDHRADIFSLGVVFYEMLTGQLPLGRFAPPSRKVQIDARLDEVVLRALDREPQLRYQHASEVKTEIDTITSTPPGSQPSTPPANPSGEHMRPRVSQPAPPPADSPHSRSGIFSRLAVGFFSLGLLGWPVLWALKANGLVALVFIVFFLALALIFGLISCPARVRWAVVIAMVVIEMVGIFMVGFGDWFDAAEHFSRLNHGLFFVLDLVVLFIVCVIVSGVMRCLSKVRAKLRTRPPPSPAAPSENRRVFARLALGFFVLPFFLKAAPENRLFLLLALIFGLISWRHLLGRVIAIVTLAILGLIAIIWFLNVVRLI
jgi:predicted Ser/Thr protein kinase